LRGFTLIELLVVIAIISLLSSVVLASLSGARASARDSKRQRHMQQLETALQTYKTQTRSYPRVGDGSWRGCSGDGHHDDTPPEGLEKGLKPLVDQDLLSQIPCDPRSNPGKFERYIYFSPGSAEWWSTQAYCGDTNVDNLAYFITYKPENTLEGVPFSGDGPVSGNTCGPGSGNGARCCVHSG